MLPAWARSLPTATPTYASAGRSVETLVVQGVDGLVVVGMTSELSAVAAASATVPTVLAGTREPDLAHIDIAVNDDYAGGSRATEHLIALGHRRIAHLRGPGLIGDLRQAGYHDALAAAELDPTRYDEYGGNSEDSGYAASRRILARADRPTAIFAFNDITAIATLSAAGDLHLDVPADLSVVGYDNTYLSRIRHLFAYIDRQRQLRSRSAGGQVSARAPRQPPVAATDVLLRSRAPRPQIEQPPLAT